MLGWGREGERPGLYLAAAGRRALFSLGDEDFLAGVSQAGRAGLISGLAAMISWAIGAGSG